jgi:hypothetical protein
MVNMTNIVDDVMGFKSPKKRIKKLSPNIIRIGDTVKIINPEIIIRVGYPMSFDDACKQVKELYHNEILEFLNKTVDKQETVPLYKSLLIAHINENEYVKSKIYRKLVYALAYEHMHRKGFGGKERKIYSEQRQELLGITAKVTKIFIKKTGIYFSPSGGYDNYSGEYDYDPGGLDKEKTHKILELDHWLSNGLVFSTEWETHYLKIEACNVEKIHEGDSQNSSD